MTTRRHAIRTTLALFGSATVLLAGSPARAEPLDPVRCEARQPKAEAQLQVARTRCVVRAERRQARGLDDGFQACEARAIAAYGTLMARAGCDVADGRSAGPPRRPARATGTAWAVIEGEALETPYEVVGDYAVIHGDVILGRLDDVQTRDLEIRDRIAAGEPAIPAPSPFQARSHTRDDFGWSRAVIPFEVSGALSTTMRNRITSAVAHWNANTIVRLQARNGEADFVRFVPGDGCFSFAGKKGGMQEIVLDDVDPDDPEDTTCSTGNVIHEIGHAVGLYHEQTRNDRDDHVIVLFDNLDDGAVVRAQYDKGPFGSVDRDGFDFNSRMLYRPDAFAAEDGDLTMTKLDGSTWTPNLTALSTGDIVGVTRMVTGLHGFFTPKDKFRNKSADRCMDADTGGSGAGVAVRDCTGATRQRWFLYTHPRTNRKLLINERSGLCLDVPGGSTTSGRDLIQFPCHGASNQAFSFTLRTFPWDPWRIRNVASNLCVALESTANGGDVEQRTCGTSDQQKWFQELL